MQYAKRRGECGLTLGATLMSRERFSAIRSLRTSCLLFGKWFMRCTGLSWEFLNVISFTWCAGFVSECAQVPPPGIEGCLLLLLSVLSQRTYLAHNAVGVAPAHVPWLPRLPHTPPGPMLHRLSNHGGGRKVVFSGKYTLGARCICQARQVPLPAAQQLRQPPPPHHRPSPGLAR